MTEDENFEEPENQRVKENHLKQILANIPGTTIKDSLSYRIEALRYFLE
jgi:hypothetical protein